MEFLKDFNEVNNPDNRRTNSVVLDEKTGTFRPLLLEDIYSFVDQLRLNDYVPQQIVDHFQMARNLYLYSWYYYPFNIAAQLYSFITIEFALKHKFADKTPIIISEGFQKPKYTSFKKLLERAVSEGFIIDRGFSHIQPIKLNSEVNSQNNGPENPEINNYCQILIEVIPELRNTLVHGSMMLNNRGGDSLIVCAEFVNQLFRK